MGNTENFSLWFKKYQCDFQYRSFTVISERPSPIDVSGIKRDLGKAIDAM